MDKICDCVQKILLECGYDTKQSLNLLDEKKVKEIENFISKHSRHFFDDIKCRHIEIYRQQDPFEFIPGHRTRLINIKEHQMDDSSQTNISLNHLALTPLLKELIHAALATQ